MGKTCTDLFAGIDCTVIGNADEEVGGIAYRSDRVQPGDAFFCIVGLTADGHSFAQDAIDRGAKVLVVERKVYLADATDVTEVVVADTRKAMAAASANFYDHPSKDFALVGITGTNGKTTTTYLVEHIAHVAGKRTGVIGTVGVRIGGEQEKTAHTTPESPDLQKLLARMRDERCGVVAMEVSSHALDLERVGVRVSRRTGDVEVALWGRPGPFPRAQVARVLADALHPTSVVRVMQKGPSRARRIAGVECLSGAGSWSEKVGSEQMRVSAPSFFQVNTAGAERLVDLVLDALRPGSDEEAMDLYCGAGTFTLPLARRAGFVSAVESYGPAVRDLRRNLERAGLDNVDPIGGDAGREFPDTDADVIVVDPPRAGLAADVVARLSEQPARAIAYVSCDPATLARDLARFEEAGSFVPTRVTPVDLFPQTYHVETVTLLERRLAGSSAPCASRTR